MTKDLSGLTLLSSSLPDLFERLPFPIAIMGDDDRVAFANREFREVFAEDHPASWSLPVEVEAPGHGFYELRTISLDGLKAVVGRDISEAVESRRQMAKMEKFVIHRFLEPVDGSPTSLAACNLNSLVESVLQTRTSTYAARNIHITTDFQTDLPEVLIDPNQIQQVLLSLLLHAELNSGNIQIRSIATDDRVRILIRCGCGKEKQDQTEADLNLDFSAEIVSRYGGRLGTWRNAVGLMIVLELPATKANEENNERGLKPAFITGLLNADYDIVTG